LQVLIVASYANGTNTDSEAALIRVSVVPVP
jgi:hypothetical protein